MITLPVRATAAEIRPLLIALGRGNQLDSIDVDFSEVRFYSPVAIAALAATVSRWLGLGKQVEFHNHDLCHLSQYLQRINFFRIFQIEIAESFRRHSANSRFAELALVGKDSGVRVENLSTKIAACISPELASVDDPDLTGPFDLVQYSISEMVANVHQHANGSGFVTAQYFEKEDTTYLGVADNGIGILESFRAAASPHWKENMNDFDAIRLALTPRVSSKTHITHAWGESTNAGVGLTLLRQLALITEGQFAIASGQGYCALKQSSLWQSPELRYFGTLCEIAIPRTNVTNFFRALRQAKENEGLLSPSVKYQEMFT